MESEGNNNFYIVLMTPPKQFFWNIESLWEKFFENQIPKTDFSGLKKKYENKKNAVETNCNSSLLKFTLSQTPNFTLSEKHVFEDEKFQNFLGLEEFSLCFQKVSDSQENRKPVYVFDNHHQALFPFWEIFREQQKNIPEISGITVVHIDAHRDDAVFPFSVGNANLRSLQEQDIHNVISQCRVSDYLDAGKKIGLIHEIISITQESEFENFLESGLKKLQSEKKPYILNLDIDIYGPEGTAVSTQLKTETIAKAWAHADAVCFATSPGFINSDLAEKLGKIMI